MGVAHQVTAIFADKLIANEIEGSRHVPAAVNIRVETAVVVYQKTIHAVFLTNQPKLLDRAGLELLNLSDDATAGPTLVEHTLAIAREHTSANHEANEVKTNKE